MPRLFSALLLLASAAASAQPPDGDGGAAAIVPLPAAASTAAYAGPGLKLLADDGLPRFEETFKARAGLIKAAKKAIRYLEGLPPERTLRVADRNYGPAALIDSAKEIVAIASTAKTADELDARVRAGFDVFQSAGKDGQGRVIFSSYFEPMLKASLKKTAGYPYPLYRRPPDMVEVDLAAFDKRFAGYEPPLGRVGKDKRVTPYPTREDIDRRKALSGKSLEVAWLKDALDVMDLHVQGSGILKLAGGRELSVRYAGSNGRPYNSVGLLLLKSGVFGRDEITHTKMHDYLRANPDAASWILASNPRYTFFDLAPLPEDGEPPGAAQESLVAARAIAIDPTVVPLGALTFFTTTSPQADKAGRLLGQFPTARFAFALDTGGAIKGPGRVDIYAGHGPQAEATARGQWADGKLFILVKKLPARRAVILGKTLQQWLDRADELGAAGRFFDAHEELEAAWNAAEGDSKILFQGLIQVAAGLHRLGLHPEKTEGAFYLLDRGVEKLDRTSSMLTPDSLAALDAAVKAIRVSRLAPKSLRFGLRAR